MAITQLARNKSEEFLGISTVINREATFNAESVVVLREIGLMRASKVPGLGIEPELNALGNRPVNVT